MRSVLPLVVFNTLSPVFKWPEYTANEYQLPTKRVRHDLECQPETLVVSRLALYENFTMIGIVTFRRGMSRGEGR